jgi:hypothetical protein
VIVRRSLAHNHRLRRLIGRRAAREKEAPQIIIFDKNSAI